MTQGATKLENDGWYACEHPERRLDWDVRFHATEPKCHGCTVAWSAAVARSGSPVDDIVFGHRPTDDELARLRALRLPEHPVAADCITWRLAADSGGMA